MTKWEYCAVKGVSSQMRDLHPTFPALWYFGEQGVQITELKSQPEKDEVAYTIAKLGMEGWEMVGGGHDGQISHILYFKRPLPQ